MVFRHSTQQNRGCRRYQPLPLVLPSPAAAAQPPVPTPDMTVPPCLKPHVNAKLSPTPVTVQHKQPRGVPRRAEWDESKERRG